MEKERRVAVYQWPNDWSFLMNMYAKVKAYLTFATILKHN